MAKLNILVTGTSGFIGKTFIQNLDGEKYRIFALDKKEDSTINSFSHRITFFSKDITIPFQLKETFDYVFHCAALNVTHVDKAAYEHYHMVNVIGTQNLIKAVHAKKFIFMSTAKVYQKTQGSIVEDSPIKPENDYEKSKFAAEEICRRFLKTNQLIILRPVNIVGPGQADKAVVPVFFKNAIKNKPLDIFASRQSVLQLLDIDDLLRLFEMLLTQDSACGIFNISSRDQISLEELVLKIISMTDSRSEIKFSSAEKVPAGKIISKKAKDILGWEARISVEEFLCKFYRSLKQSPDC